MLNHPSSSTWQHITDLHSCSLYGFNVAFDRKNGSPLRILLGRSLKCFLLNLTANILLRFRQNQKYIFLKIYCVQVKLFSPHKYIICYTRFCIITLFCLWYGANVYTPWWIVYRRILDNPFCHVTGFVKDMRTVLRIQAFYGQFSFIWRDYDSRKFF